LDDIPYFPDKTNPEFGDFYEDLLMFVKENDII
jgi:hypothetical protein